jgi:hypothetical protein
VVKAAPGGGFGFPVASIEPGRVLCLAGEINTKTGKPTLSGNADLKKYFGGDQTFVITLLDEKSLCCFFAIMGRKMLLEVKKRAER